MFPHDITPNIAVAVNLRRGAVNRDHWCLRVVSAVLRARLPRIVGKRVVWWSEKILRRTAKGRFEVRQDSQRAANSGQKDESPEGDTFEAFCKPNCASVRTGFFWLVRTPLNQPRSHEERKFGHSSQPM